MDDATSALMRLKFFKSEITFSYFETLRRYLAGQGRPIALLFDKPSVFRATKAEANAGDGMTQLRRALHELNVEILFANSSYPKGRVEGANRTLQDRLVKELRLNRISDTEGGISFLRDSLTATMSVSNSLALRADPTIFTAHRISNADGSCWDRPSFHTVWSVSMSMPTHFLTADLKHAGMASPCHTAFFITTEM